MMEIGDAARQQSFHNIERSMQRIDECFVEIQNNTNDIRSEIRSLQSNEIRSRSASRSANAIELD